MFVLGHFIGIKKNKEYMKKIKEISISIHLNLWDLIPYKRDFSSVTQDYVDYNFLCFTLTISK